MTSSDSLLNAVMALASEAILIIDVETLRYVAFNDATCRMTGRSREELDRLGPLGMWAEAGGSPRGCATTTPSSSSARPPPCCTSRPCTGPTAATSRFA